MGDVNKRFGLFPIYKENQERDWQLTGYWDNWILALKFVPRDTLISFRTPFINGTTEAPSTMKVRRLRIVANEPEVLSEQTITSDLLVETSINDGVTQTYYYRQKGLFTANELEYLTIGYIYDIYIEDSDGNKFISDIFCAISETDLYLYAESNEAYLTEDGQEIIFE